VSGGTGSEREGGKLTVVASMADAVELCTREDERWVPFIGGKRSRALVLRRKGKEARTGGPDLPWGACGMAVDNTDGAWPAGHTW
jgi:hypothetical protein